MTKKILKENIERIFNMDKAELQSFIMSLSNTILDGKAQHFIFRAIEDRELELDSEVSPMAEMASINYD